MALTFPEPSRTRPPRRRSLAFVIRGPVDKDVLPTSERCFGELPVVLLRDNEEGNESEMSVDISPEVRFRAFLVGETREPERAREVGTAGMGESARIWAGFGRKS